MNQKENSRTDAGEDARVSGIIILRTEEYDEI
jgi:hypothetical protein